MFICTYVYTYIYIYIYIHTHVVCLGNFTRRASSFFVLKLSFGVFTEYLNIFSQQKKGSALRKEFLVGQNDRLYFLVSQQKKLLEKNSALRRNFLALTLSVKNSRPKNSRSKFQSFILNSQNLIGKKIVDLELVGRNFCPLF